MLCRRFAKTMHRRFLYGIGACGLALFLALFSAPIAWSADARESDLSGLIRQGDEHFRMGRIEAAIAVWSDALARARAAGAPADEVAILARRGEAFQALGYHPKSIADLRQAVALARSSGDVDTEHRLRGSLGTVLYLARDLDPDLSAQTELQACLDYARRRGDERLAAQTLNNLGNLLASRDLPAAQASYQEGRRLARRAGARDLEATAHLNAIRVTLDGLEQTAGAEPASDPVPEVQLRLTEAEAQLRELPDSGWKAAAMVTAGQQWMRLTKLRKPHGAVTGDAAARAFRGAASIARALDDVRTLSYAVGFEGALAESEGRLEDALRLTRQALFHAREIRALELEYRWHWQRGRLLHARQERDAAVLAYAQAVASVRALRQDLLRGGPRGYAAFRKDVAPMFFELVDLYLQRAQRLEQAGDWAANQAALRSAIGVIEEFKAASIEYFFADDCVARLQATARSVGELSRDAGVIYPIMLADRLEILLEVADGLTRHTLPVDRGALTAAIDSFLKSLGRPNFAHFRSAGARLYQWLIAPVESALAAAGVDTVVFVLHDALATVPMSALYDCDAERIDNDCDGYRARGGRSGEYLVEKYAVAVAPGLTLLDARPLGTRATADALLIGLSEGVQGFPPLQQVTSEIAQIGSTMSGKVLMNSEFTKQRVASELDARSFTVMHIASHAEFRNDARSSFVVAYDDKLSMNDLESLMSLSRFRDQPVELLTLSACETAVGDELAALGLAGIAVKAGARSALASLWAVDDAATAVLIPEFYRQLREPGTSKAQALRRAQIHLLRSEQAFSHPRFWAPFLMIGNWL